MTRSSPSGDMKAITNRIQEKYNTEMEIDVIKWIKSLSNIDLQPGINMMQAALKDGQILLTLAQALQKDTINMPQKATKMNLKINITKSPFKQMENIESFVNFCEAYGVGQASIFQTVDLYEGQNMPQVLICLQQLGTEAQRNQYNGMTIGPKPTEKRRVSFTKEQMNMGKNIVSLQYGSNKGDTQKGISMGAPRTIINDKISLPLAESGSILSLQSGTNKLASQKGQSCGKRQIVDSETEQHGASKKSNEIVSLQMGQNKKASQAGDTASTPRQIVTRQNMEEWM